MFPRIKIRRLFFYLLLYLCLVLTACAPNNEIYPPNRPNFLFIVTDDQSWKHTSKEGYPLVATPNFDRIANEGLYFQNAFASAPSCTPSRSAMLTGQHFWQLESGGLLNSRYPDSAVSYQNLLEGVGYEVGYTGKGWGPGVIPPSARHPLGKSFDRRTRDVPDYLGSVDLAANFNDFLGGVSENEPFSFWVGSVDPHRPFNPKPVNRFENAALESTIPGFLPPSFAVQSQLSAYLDEIEHFDDDLGKILDALEAKGQLDNTVIVVTSDNGMPFTRAKTQNYSWGVQVPLAISWTGLKNTKASISDFINLTDIAPTFLELAGVAVPEKMTGQSLMPYFEKSDSSTVNLEQQRRDLVFTGYERHAGFIRGGQANLTYPRRAVHTKDFVYIRNFLPDRWPVGDPPAFVEAFPFLLRNAQGKTLEPYYSLVTSKRPQDELYDLRNDPDQLVNLAADPSYSEVLNQLKKDLFAEQMLTQDPIVSKGLTYFEQFPYF